MRHRLIGIPDPEPPTYAWHIQRIYEDAKGPRIVQWCGRDTGWAFTGGGVLKPKAYASRGLARNALTAILGHERALGLRNRLNERY